MAMKMLQIDASPEASRLLSAHGQRATKAATKYLEGVPANQRDDALATLEMISAAYRRALSSPDLPQN